VPAANALNTPDPVVIVPTAGHALLHVPPTGDPLNVMVELSHTCSPAPDGLILVGIGFTSTTIVL